ncbi:LysR family transcriptional regulator [Chondromyces crocatus]|uniref:LysR family transcriptional regulator n=1 Tax=Chondromyces crocatus TaxID=52 RepID=A0A0K1EBS1_CHOCO|nr:LysR family transcriptional regulator [Chondromyces crocatus]AKT38117.1 LysR family transcriptional regulator [Chondromyces crocatus]
MSPQPTSTALRRSQSLSAIEVVLQVAETLSFVEAGRRLGLSASAVGKSIRTLEERFGVRLFYRTTRQVSLTEDGARFLVRCERILAELEGAELELSRRHAAPRGRLRVALPTASAFFSPLLADFAREYPEIALDVELGDRLVDLVHEGFDVAIRTGEPDDSRLSSRKLASFRHVIVAAPTYFDSNPIPKNPSDLGTHRLLLYKKPHTGKIEPWPVGSMTTSIGLGARGGIIANNIDALVRMALAGQGLCSVPDYFVHRELEDGRLVRVLKSSTRGTTTFRLLWPTKAQQAPKVRAFVDFFAARLPPGRSAEPRHE